MQVLRIHALIAILLLGLPFSARALTLSGKRVQGGMSVGHVAPGSRVSFEGRPIRVSPDGIFVIGFSRDAKAQAMLTLRTPQGGIEKHPITIEARQYDIQRIDGLPPKKVTPTAEADLARIRADIALVRKVRKRDDARTDFDRPFIWPVVGRISGVYGSQRILNGNPRRPHFGVDIAAPTGTPVKAPADGVVSLARDDMFYSGGTLIVDHGHGISTVYMHLSKILVAEGTRVRQGDVIAQVGATGRVTGPHLHWGMNWFETRLDPSLLVPPMSEMATSDK